MNTVGELKDSVAGILSGTNLDKVTGLNKALQRAARKLLQKADVPEAMKRESITLYDGVYDYPISEDIFGGALVDLRPQGNSRFYFDEVQKTPLRQFDRQKGIFPSGYRVTMETVKGVPRLRVDTPKPLPRVNLDAMTDDDWTVGGSLSGLVVDETVYYNQPASLRFTLTGASTGTLTKAINQVNLASYEDLGVAFLALRIQAANLTSVALRIGSSDSAYDEVTETDGFLGAFQVGEWLLVAFDFSGATATGTPDWTAIDYVQLRFAHTGTMTVRVGGLWLALPSPHEVIYQSAAIFLTNGTLSRTITSDDTEIVLSDPAYLLYEHECALAIAVQKTMDKKAEELRAILYGGEGDGGLYRQYVGDNPSNELRTIGSYYG